MKAKNSLFDRCLYAPENPLPHQLPANRGRYSLLRALYLNAHRRDLDGFEGEISQEIARRSAKAPIGFYVPLDLSLFASVATTAALASGSSPLWERTFLKTLQARSVAVGLGAQLLTDLNGSIADLPEISRPANASFVDEAIPNPEHQEQQVAMMRLNARTLMAYSDLPRRLLSQAFLPTAERIAFNDLSAALALAIDRGLFAGVGTDPEPTGILYRDDVPEQELGADGAALARADLIAVERAMADAAANIDPRQQGWVTTSAVRATLRAVEKATGTGLYVWGDDDRLLSYPAQTSPGMPADLTKGADRA